MTPGTHTPVADRNFLHLDVVDAAVSRVRRFLKGRFHAARNLPDRVLHNRRHSSTVRRVSQMERPRRILIVCHGNICRSPYLEARLRLALPGISISSAGFIGRDRAVPTFSREVSARRGIDLTQFRSQLISPDNVRNADLVIVMEPSQARHIGNRFGISDQRLVIAGDLDPKPSPTRAIPDPWMQPVETFEATFNRLDRCAEALVIALNQRS